jgi:hypothetical protein
MTMQRIDEYAGLRRELEIGLRIAPTVASAIPAAKAVASFLDESPAVTVRLAGLTCEDSRVLITVAICLGSIDEIKSADPVARSAVQLIGRIVRSLSAYDPAFVTLPQSSSIEAVIAAHVMARGCRTETAVLAAVGRLTATG